MPPLRAQSQRISSNYGYDICRYDQFLKTDAGIVLLPYEPRGSLRRVAHQDAIFAATIANIHPNDTVQYNMLHRNNQRLPDSLRRGN
jgi:hypothetical protein